MSSKLVIFEMGSFGRESTAVHKDDFPKSESKFRNRKGFLSVLQGSNLSGRELLRG
jgi:hypothetical protein